MAQMRGIPDPLPLAGLTGRQIAQRYLAKAAPGLRLGPLIAAGASGQVYGLEENDEVLKVVDSCGPGVYGGLLNEADRRRCNAAFLRGELAALAALQDCPYTVKALQADLFYNPQDPDRCLGLIRMRRLRRLSEWLAENPVSMAELQQLMTQVGLGLEACHRAGFAHQDVKVDNIYIEPLPAGGKRFLLGDFGIVCRPGAKEAEIVEWLMAKLPPGTPAFMAPEKQEVQEANKGRALQQMQRTYRKADAFCGDVYSLGAVAYCLLAGYPRSSKTPPPSAAELTGSPLGPIVERACSRVLPGQGPDSRYAAAGPLLEALGGCTLREPNEPVVRMGYLLAAKLAYLEGRRQQAERCLRQGIHNSAEGCGRMLAYLELKAAQERLDRLEKEPGADREALRQARYDRDRLLEEDGPLRRLAARGDCIADGLYGICLYSCTDRRAEGRAALERSALGGWAEGRYYVGKLLWREGSRHAAVQEYLLPAARQGDLPALRFFAKHSDLAAPYLTPEQRRWLQEQQPEQIRAWLAQEADPRLRRQAAQKLEQARVMLL